MLIFKYLTYFKNCLINRKPIEPLNIFPKSKIYVAYRKH